MDTDGRTVFLSVIIALSVSYFLHSLMAWRRLSHMPGPFWAAFSKMWMVKHALKGRQPIAFKDVNDIYGTIARVGPNELITSDPDVLQRIMAVRSEYTRGPWYHGVRFDPTRDNLLSLRDEVAHNKLRSQMAHGYSGKENTSMEGTIDTQITNFVRLLKTKYLSTNDDYRPCDFGEKASFFTLDVISDLSFSEPFGYLEQDGDVYEYLKITKSFMPIMMILVDLPSVTAALHSPLLRGFLPSESDKFGFGAFISVAKRLVEARFAPGAKYYPDMLGSFIRRGLSQEEAAGEALLQVVAGSDTTAGTIRTVMLGLLTNPTAYERLKSEIDQGITSNQISSPITDFEGRQMPYLQAVIREGLRLMPPASGSFFKQVPPEGDTINGIFVPGGTQIGSSPLAIHRSKNIFGADADLFRPDRWLAANTERFAKMANTVDLVFHYGKWQCLGKPVAQMELNKIFVELLRRFDFSIVRPEHPATIYNAGIWVVEDFMLRVESRG